MHTTPIFSQKIYLIENTSCRWEYNDLTHAANELYRLRLYGPFHHDDGHIGIHHVEKHKRFDWMVGIYEPSNSYYQFIVRSELGDVITVKDLQKARTLPKWRWISRKETVERHGEFRRSPVPFTGKRSWGGVRRISTTPERRTAVAHSDKEMKEHGVKVRAKRNKSNLPNTWDDYWRHNMRSWKKHRKHQWKQK